MNLNGVPSQASQSITHAAATPEGLPPYLDIKQVEVLTTLCRSSVYNRMEDPIDPLPRPGRIGRRVMWSRDEVLLYMASRMKKRGGTGMQRQTLLSRPS